MLIRNSEHDIDDEIDCGLHGKLVVDKSWG